MMTKWGSMVVKNRKLTKRWSLSQRLVQSNRIRLTPTLRNKPNDRSTNFFCHPNLPCIAVIMPSRLTHPTNNRLVTLLSLKIGARPITPCPYLTKTKLAFKSKWHLCDVRQILTWAYRWQDQKKRMRKMRSLARSTRVTVKGPRQMKTSTCSVNLSNSVMLL